MVSLSVRLCVCLCLSEYWAGWSVGAPPRIWGRVLGGEGMVGWGVGVGGEEMPVVYPPVGLHIYFCVCLIVWFLSHYAYFFNTRDLSGSPPPPPRLVQKSRSSNLKLRRGGRSYCPNRDSNQPPLSSSPVLRYRPSHLLVPFVLFFHLSGQKSDPCVTICPARRLILGS